MKWYRKAIMHYADFNGRASRTEYWMFLLFNIIFLLAALFLDNMAGTAIPEVDYGLFYILYLLFIILPSLAVAVRRLHDVGKSGWFILIGLIPLVGAIWLFVLYVTDSQPGANEYGANPKEEAV